MDRLAFIQSMIGKPWKANAKGPDEFDCWHMTKYVQEVLFNRTVPLVVVPDEPTWPWMIEQFTQHKELQNWVEHSYSGFCSYVAAADGAIVLMARYRQPAHCGVWLKPERGVLHCEEQDGVTFMDLVTLRSIGWAKLRFYEPRT